MYDCSLNELIIGIVNEKKELRDFAPDLQDILYTSLMSPDIQYNVEEGDYIFIYDDIAIFVPSNYLELYNNKNLIVASCAEIDRVMGLFADYFPMKLVMDGYFYLVLNPLSDLGKQVYRQLSWLNDLLIKWQNRVGKISLEVKYVYPLKKSRNLFLANPSLQDFTLHFIIHNNEKQKIWQIEKSVKLLLESQGIDLFRIINDYHIHIPINKKIDNMIARLLYYPIANKEEKRQIRRTYKYELAEMKAFDKIKTTFQS